MVDDLTGFGKISQSIEQATKEVRQLSYDFLDPPVKEAGQWIAERIRFYRVSSAISTLTKARQQLQSAGLPVKSVDLKTFLPLIEFSSLEEDPDMIERWAGLLASAATNTSSVTSYVHILNQLTPRDARVLDSVLQTSEPAMSVENTQYYAVSTAFLTEATQTPIDQMLIILGNLVRLGLVQRMSKHSPALVWGNPPLGALKEDMVGLTPLGRGFLEACVGPDIP
jgi:hypothetical protein